MIRKKFSRKEILLGIISTIIIVFILSFYIWHQTESINLGYETGKLEQKIVKLQKEIETLEAEKARLLSLEKVEKTAVNRLRMVKPDDKQILYMDFSKVGEKE